MSENARDYYRQVGLLSQQVATKEDLLSQSSCMAENMRLVYCLMLECASQVQDIKIKEFILKLALPYIKALGFGLWKRDIVSDMGLRIGLTTTEETTPDEDLNFETETDSSESSEDL